MKLYLHFLCICSFTMALPAAATARTMIVSPVSAEPQKFEITTGTRITFPKDRSKMIVSDGISAPAEFDICDIASIVFSMDSAIDGVEAELNDLHFSNAGGILTISGAPTISYAVWNLSGHQMAAGQGDRSVSLDFTTLAAGVYIVKANNRTIKYINR